MSLYAPYNFVPLNKKVVLPHWVHQISHDIPFADTQSGEFKVKITAKTPIFVKDGLSKTEEARKYRNDIQIIPHEFCQYNGQYYIPGSSIKGMLRNVLEIMSFGRMDKVNDHRYAVRDLNNKELYQSHFGTDKVYGGWLQKDENDTYTISGWGFPGRISHQELQDKYKVDFATYFSTGGNFDPRKDTEKAGKRKYDKFGNRSKIGRFTFLKEDVMRQIYTVAEDVNQGSKGELVFTGQSGFREYNHKQNKMVGHFYEFIFFDQDANQAPLTVSDEVMENFFFAYFDKDKNRHSVDWKWRKPQLDQGERIPVFFQKDAKGVTHLGLSYLYKLPYKYSVQESIDLDQVGRGIDLSDAIFGYIDDAFSLKGRVHIGHAFAKNNPTPVPQVVEAVLSSPKASYYPTYMQQKVNNGRTSNYKTFMNKSSIAGWKRYPSKKTPITNARPARSTDKIVTQFRPLQAGATFEFFIRYHNLRKIELGALLSALTYHNTPNVYHSIGMGKPLGYGVIDIEIQNISNKEELLCAYEAYMDAALGHSANLWHQSEQIKELFTMASFQNSNGVKLEYMPLKGFRDAKKRNNKFALGRYSSLQGISEKVVAKSCTNPSNIKAMKEWIAHEASASDTNQSIADQYKAVEKMAEIAFEKRKDQLLAKILERQKQKAHQEANQPQTASPKSLLKRAKPVDAKVVGQKGNMVVFTPFVEGFEEKQFEIRYPAGFEVGTIIVVTMQAIRKGKDLQVQGYPKLK